MTHAASQVAEHLPWQGSAMMTVGMAAFVGTAGDNRSHRHYAVQLVIAADHVVRLYRRAGEIVEGAVVGCAAGISHRLEPSSQRLAIIYLEPTSTLGRIADARLRTMQVLDGQCRPDLFALLSSAIERLQPAPIESAIRALLRIPARAEPAIVDPRILRVLEVELRGTMLPPLTEAASLASLSPSRFSHLFARDMGIAYRAFAKWRKLLSAVSAVAAGGDLTAAAHSAGFADSAHFSRTFSDMFGLAPSRAFSRLTVESVAHEG